MFHSLSPVLTTDASISINTSIRSSCASEDSCDISISVLLMAMLMFSEDMVNLLLWPATSESNGAHYYWKLYHKINNDHDKC